MDWTLLSWAFLAGAAATVNPCGVAMLPAYISYYLGSREGAPSLGRGLYAGLLLATGTMATFTAMGIVLAGLGTAVARFIPWAALLVALMLLVAGVATLIGHAPRLAIASRPRAPAESGPGSFVGFGVGYGLASLGCTLPIFMIVVSTVLSSAFLTGLLAFVAYGLGMGAVLTGVSAAVALGKTAVLRWLRSAGPALRYIGGVGLLVAGSYLIAYNLDGLSFMLSGSDSGLPRYVAVAAFVMAVGVAAVLAARRGGTRP